MVTMQTERFPIGALRISRLLVVPLLCIFTLDPGNISAQTATDPPYTIRVDSDLVDLRVSVVRLNPDLPVAALQQKDFLVFEDGKPQEIIFFEGQEAPFDLVLLLDLSGSTADKIGLVRDSARRFVEATREMDRIAIVTFTDVPEIVSPLTADRASLKKAIKELEKPISTGTNFWDSLLYTLENVLPSQKASRRSAIVVMTDGVDNALPDVFGDGSRISFEELLTRVDRSDAIVFPIYLDTEKELVKRSRIPRDAYTTARSQLAQLAEGCGTVVYRAEKLKDLDRVYHQVTSDLSTVYSVGYQPTNTLRDGKWRSVVVQLVGRPDVSARTKRGYYARPDD